MKYRLKEGKIFNMGNLSKKQIVVIIVVALAILLLLFYYFKLKNRKKKVKSKFDSLQFRYNSIKSVPLDFKLKKALSIARIDSEIMNKVKECQVNYEAASNNLNELSQLFEESEDLISANKYKTIDDVFGQIDDKLKIGEIKVNEISDFLDTILEREAHERAKANILKDRFSNLKETFRKSYPLLGRSVKNIENEITDCEQLFSAFEEWVYASDYIRAKESLEEAEAIMDKLDNIIKISPELLEIAEGAIPVLYDETKRQYALTRQRGVYLGHLNVDDNLKQIKERLNDASHNIQVGKIEEVRKELDAITLDLRTLLRNFNKENEAFVGVKSVIELINEEINLIDNNYNYIQECYELEKDKFELGSFDELVISKDKYLNYYHETSSEIRRLLDDNQTPSSVLNDQAISLLKELNAKQNELKEIKNRIDNAKADEERANTQLLKFQLILNEMKTKIASHKLPSISDAYKDDLARGYEYINNIDEALKEVPLNRIKLKSVVDETLDYIYKLYNNVNNVVGMAGMVENTIVFGNKYRSSYPEVDSELTRAELAYHNGEYTQALTIAIAAIEKLFPNSLSKEVMQAGGEY